MTYSGDASVAIDVGKDCVETAEVATQGALVLKCAQIYFGLAAARFSSNDERECEQQAEIKYDLSMSDISRECK